MSYASSRPLDRLTVGTFTATTSAVQVQPQGITCYSINFQSDPNNSQDVYIGNNIAQPIHLLPGQSINVDTNAIQNFYAITTSGSALINWMATG